jgi:DNA-binding protein HU-beta
MNKGELIKELADTTGYTQKDAAAFLEAYVEVVTKALKAGEKIQLVGFGTYELKKRAAGIRTNPQTKAKVSVPASNVPAFKFGKAYKGIFN